MRLIRRLRSTFAFRPVRLIVLALASGTLLATGCSGGGGGGTKLIVYEAGAADKTSNVWTIDSVSGQSTQITHGTGFDGHPGWSPDHKRIIFVSDRDRGGRQEEIYEMRADGSDPQRITNSTGDIHNWSPKFSGDGKQIAYVTVESSTSYFLSLMNADGTDQRHIAGPYKFAEFPAWTRDGEEIYFAAITADRSDPDLYSIDTTSLEVQTRVSTPAAEVCPHFSRDGKRLTYASVASGAENAGNVDLFGHDMSSGRAGPDVDTRLTTAPETDDYANASPDDKTLVFIARRDGNSELYLMDRDGGNQRRLTTTPDVAENVPDW